MPWMKLLPVSPVSVSLKFEPVRYWMFTSVSPSASPCVPVPVASETATDAIAD